MPCKLPDEINYVTDDVFSYMCSLAMEKCSRKSDKKKASCGGAAMRKRLLIKNFVSQMLAQERQSKEQADSDPESPEGPIGKDINSLTASSSLLYSRNCEDEEIDEEEDPDILEDDEEMKAAASLLLKARSQKKISPTKSTPIELTILRRPRLVGSSSSDDEEEGEEEAEEAFPMRIGKPQFQQIRHRRPFCWSNDQLVEDEQPGDHRVPGPAIIEHHPVQIISNGEQHHNLTIMSSDDDRHTLTSLTNSSSGSTGGNSCWRFFGAGAAGGMGSLADEDDFGGSPFGQHDYPLLQPTLMTAENNNNNNSLLILGDKMEGESVDGGNNGCGGGLFLLERADPYHTHPLLIPSLLDDHQQQHYLELDNVSNNSRKRPFPFCLDEQMDSTGAHLSPLCCGLLQLQPFGGDSFGSPNILANGGGGPPSPLIKRVKL